jgi:hypothetical protein
VLLQIQLNVAILLGAAGVALSILFLTYRVGQLKSQLDNLSEVSKLTGQIEMIDASKAATIPDTIQEMRQDLTGMRRQVGKIDDVKSSAETIERSVTNIDFEGIENAIDSLVDGGLPTGNSVVYTLEEVGIDVIISLSAIEDDHTEVNFRFEENVGARNLVESVTDDEGLATFEQELFGEEPRIYVISPRQIEASVPSGDMEKIVSWAARLVERLDIEYIRLHKSKEEFDELLEENLKGEE